MRTVVSILAVILCVCLAASNGGAQGKWNFPDSKALTLDISPHVKITNFYFENTVEGRASTSKHTFHYTWKNVGTVPVLAFELVTLKYDPFDEPMLGARTLVAGRNSADFSPLPPGESDADGTIGFGHTHTLTAIAYVRVVRFTDGTLWRAEPSVVAAAVKKAAPRIRDVGPLVPTKDKGDEKKP